MPINPIVTKLLSSAAIKATSDEGGKKAILIVALVPVIVVLLLLCFLTYILSSPLGFLLNLLGINTGDTKAAIENYKKQNDAIVALPVRPVKIEGKYARPINGAIEIDYGNGSNGIVFSAMPNSEVLGIANSGQVVVRGTDSQYGQYVLIKYEQLGETFYCFYGNLSRVDAMQDQEIKQGSIIGRSSDKLYFEVRTTPDASHHVDPKLYICTQAKSTETPLPSEVPTETPSPVPSADP